MPEEFGGSAALALALAASVAAVSARAQDDEDLARRLADRYMLDVRPGIPFAINDRWSLIPRTLLPFVERHDVFSRSQWGTGDITQGLLFSRAQPTAGGLTWGAGPVLVVPTGGSSQAAAKRWALGPMGVVVSERGAWTYGVLGNHVSSIGADSEGAATRSTFIQPFLSFTTKSAWTYTLNSESTYDWKSKAWSVPVNLTATRLWKIGDVHVGLGAGVRWWADGPESASHNWGARVVVTFLLPK